jgi:hypothetical protein
MAWKVELDPAAERELDKLDPRTARRILRFLQGRVGWVSAERRRATSTTSPLVSRPSVPPGPKVSSSADTVCQPSVANNPMAGCSTSWSSV